MSQGHWAELLASCARPQAGSLPGACQMAEGKARCCLLSHPTLGHTCGF